MRGWHGGRAQAASRLCPHVHHFGGLRGGDVDPCRRGQQWSIGITFSPLAVDLSSIDRSPPCPSSVGVCLLWHAQCLQWVGKIIRGLSQLGAPSSRTSTLFCLWHELSKQLTLMNVPRLDFSLHYTVGKEANRP